MNKLGKCLSETELFFCDGVDRGRTRQWVVIKDQFLNATLLQTGNPMCGVAHPSKLEERKLQTGDPMCGIAHPSKLEERKCWRLGLRVEVEEGRRSRHSDSGASAKRRLRCWAEPVEGVV